eukprot:4047119-Lingulodinium_polyedra.AAC.1
MDRRQWQLRARTDFLPVQGMHMQVLRVEALPAPGQIRLYLLDRRVGLVWVVAALAIYDDHNGARFDGFADH